MAIKIKKSDIFLKAKMDISTMLNSIKNKIYFQNATLYVVDESFYKDLLIIDATLNSLENDTYKIKKIVNILNPEHTAVWYSLTIARQKSSQIKDRSKCIEKMSQQYEVSKRFHESKVDDQLNELKDDEEYEYLKSKILHDLKERLDQEKKYFSYLKNNLSNKNIKFMITNYETANDYGQIYYKYFDNISKKLLKITKHLSIEKPNILIYKKTEFEKRPGKESVASFVNAATRAFGNFYFKEEN